MGFLESNCTFRQLTSEILLQSDSFDCSNEDLNDFFKHDSIDYSSALLGKSYCFTLDGNPKTIICAFTVSNDSIKVNDLPNSRKKTVIREIPREKHMRNYPAVLIGRLGVNNNYKGKHIGTELMDFIKAWFIDSENKTGCRFIVVDSYNTVEAISYYEKNGFKKMFSTDEQEKEYYEMVADDMLGTKLLFFDLIVLKN